MFVDLEGIRDVLVHASINAEPPIGNAFSDPCGLVLLATHGQHLDLGQPIARLRAHAAAGPVEDLLKRHIEIRDEPGAPIAPWDSTVVA